MEHSPTSATGTNWEADAVARETGGRVGGVETNRGGQRWPEQSGAW